MKEILKEFNINEFKVGQNLYIDASAGTGKTYTIQQLTAKMVKEGIPLEKILIVTYTDKAAGELRDRIRQKLEDCVAIDADDCYTIALQNINDAPIFTIHSFCKNTLEVLAYDANAAMSMEVIDDSYIINVIEKLIRDEWAYTEEFQNLIKQPEFDFTEFKEKCVKTALLFKGCDDVYLKAIADKNLENFILKNLITIVNKWEQYKKDNKFQSYDNMIKTVHDEVCLSENSALLQKLRKTYRYAIIDEFQDTNQRQWDIFKTVFLDNSKIDSEDKNNIIVVGDPKQSIYAFQGADLQVYRNAVSEIGHENGRRLSVNNRSSDILITACNTLFSKDFFDDKGDFSDSNCPPDERKKLPAELNGKITQPLWISDKLSPEEFCKYATQKILECCRRDDNGKTALQIYDKTTKELRNVEFSDFAVLGRTKKELEYMETVMNSVGIPYTRYKDDNLFSGTEAYFWIFMLKAINAPDFAGYNRKFLNSVLISDFFRLKFSEVNKDIYSDPTKSPMKEILNWKMLASKRRWSELQECIYSDTGIDKYLNVPNKLQSLAKIRQIGSYIFDYLYNHKTSLETAIKHLEGLSIATDTVDETDANLIAKGCDFKTVKVMTCHASKGLAFPITIVLGGMKGFWNQMPGPFLYRSENGKNIGFTKEDRTAYKKEVTEEYHRLIYVAYTRAESLMILPRYDKKLFLGFEFFNNALKRMTETDYANKEKLVRQNDSFDAEGWDPDVIREEFKNILETIRGGEFSNQNEDVEKQISELQNNINRLRIWSYSYTSIASKKKSIESLEINQDESEEASFLDGRFNKEEALSDSDNKVSDVKTINIDPEEGILRVCKNYSATQINRPDDYPKGSKLGNAIHSIFEKIDFYKFGDLPAAKVAEKNTIARGTVAEAFEIQSLPIKNHWEWVPYTARLVWNTLNADLPIIHGNEATEGYFKLKDISEECKKAEMEFFIDVKNRDWLNRFCKGYMDLLFVRKDEAGNEYYSILDWKSDVLDDTAYSNGEALREKVDKEYSVQRVLYSYCLIKWLKQFYQDLSYEDIFNQHFGGIYYVFVRGCKADTSNGIYAQTWKSFKALQESYENILKLMEA